MSGIKPHAVESVPGFISIKYAKTDVSVTFIIDMWSGVDARIVGGELLKPEYVRSIEIDTLRFHSVVEYFNKRHTIPKGLRS